MELSAEYSIYQDQINNILSCMFQKFVPEELLVEPPVGDNVYFIDHQIPDIKSGTYELKATQKLTTPSATLNAATSSPAQQFYIDGPRFLLEPSDILSVFPPAGSTGDHRHVLPHLALKRISIPWETSRLKLDWESGDTVADEDPWLALLLFDETDMPEVQTEKLKDLHGINANFEFHDEDQKVNTIEILKTQAQTLLKGKDLRFLAHIRQTAAGAEGGEVLSEQAFLLGNRLAKSNATSTVHLVSLANFPTANDAASNVKFISLYNWSYICPKAAPTFRNLMMDLDARAFRLYGNEGNANKSLTNYTNKGYVPMPHFLRKGKQTFSWYRSPLLPDASCLSSPDLTMRHGADHYLQFDTHSADQQQNADTKNLSGSNMLMVSYAAAWQLGRMLTLEQTDVALAIQRLKRKVAQAIKNNDLQKGDYLDFLKTRTLTEQQQNLVNCVKAMAKSPNCSEVDGASSDLQFDAVIAKWLVRLLTLEVVPSNYLLPHPDMLPQNSLRFFVLDFNWIIALIEGALSVGGNEHFNLPTPTYQKRIMFSGFLLRSEVVGDYPDMNISAYPRNPQLIRENAGIPPIIKRNLSNDIMLCMFPLYTEGQSLDEAPHNPIEKLEFFLNKEAFHMGFDLEGDPNNPELVKKVRDAEGQQKPTLNNANYPYKVANAMDANNVIDIAALRTGLNQFLANPIDTPNEFALQMVEGGSKVIVPVVS